MVIQYVYIDLSVISLPILSLDNTEQCAAAVDTAIRSCSYTSEIGITVGVVTSVVFLVVIVITVIAVRCLWR